MNCILDWVDWYNSDIKVKRSTKTKNSLNLKDYVQGRDCMISQQS